MHPIPLAFSVMTSLLSTCPSGVSASSKKVGWPKCQDGVWILFITVSDKASRLITSFLWSQFKQLMCVSPQPFGFTVHCKMLLYISSIYCVDLLWKHVTIGWLKPWWNICSFSLYHICNYHSLSPCWFCILGSCSLSTEPTLHVVKFS